MTTTLKISTATMTPADLAFVALLRERATIQDGECVIRLRPCPTIPVRSLLTFRERAVRFGVHGLERRHCADPDETGMRPTDKYLDAVERMYGSRSCPIPEYVVRTSPGWRSMPDDLTRLRALRSEFQAYCASGMIEPVPVQPAAEAVMGWVCDALFGTAI